MKIAYLFFVLIIFSVPKSIADTNKNCEIKDVSDLIKTLENIRSEENYLPEKWKYSDFSTSINEHCHTKLIERASNKTHSYREYLFNQKSELIYVGAGQYAAQLYCKKSTKSSFVNHDNEFYVTHLNKLRSLDNKLPSSLKNPVEVNVVVEKCRVKVIESHRNEKSLDIITWIFDLNGNLIDVIDKGKISRMYDRDFPIKNNNKH